VGVDLERLDATFPVREIAATYFHGPEISAVLQARDEAEATERFYRYWTAKEALMKATGLGMSLEPQHIHLTLDVRTLQPSGIARIAYAGLDAAHWTLHAPPPPAGLALAVVTGN
jgi:4'-phosphopantetheinyl transferase